MMGIMAILGTHSTSVFGPQPFTTGRVGGSGRTSNSSGCCESLIEGDQIS
jgi:hypothetical protein